MTDCAALQVHFHPATITLGRFGEAWSQEIIGHQHGGLGKQGSLLEGKGSVAGTRKPKTLCHWLCSVACWFGP